MVIKTMSGLGDCIYLRPIIRKLPARALSLITQWPQVFTDLGPIKFIKPEHSRLRTQQQNVDEIDPTIWASEFAKPDLQLYYDLTHHSIIHNYCQQVLGAQPAWMNNDWEFNCGNSNPFPNSNKPICLIRPNTLRKEWYINSRGPDNTILQRFIDKYKEHYYIVSLANLKGSEEWYEDRLVGCDEYIEDATSVEKTLQMFHAAALIVCSVSFWVPMALALNKRTICIYGGHVHPQRIVDERIKRDNFFELIPEPFCHCMRLVHNCNKKIDLKIVDRIFEEATSA